MEKEALALIEATGMPVFSTPMGAYRSSSRLPHLTRRYRQDGHRRIAPAIRRAMYVSLLQQGFDALTPG